MFTSVFCYGFSGSSSLGCDSVVSTRRRRCRCRCVLCDLCTSGLVAALGTACCMYECVCVSSIPNWPLATLPLLWPPVFNCTLRSNRICALFSAVNPKYTAHSECISVYICVPVCVCVVVQMKSQCCILLFFCAHFNVSLIQYPGECLMRRNRGHGTECSEGGGGNAGDPLMLQNCN